ncbi:hypothetical protein PYCC9005_003231 [Savitreella phatthalungensis]
MAQVASGNPDQAHFKFLDHLSSIPIVHESLEHAGHFPIAARAGDAIKHVSNTAYRYAGPTFEPYLVKADSYADAGLRELEHRFPLVKEQPSVIREKTSGAAKTTVDTYVGAAKERFGQASSQAKSAGEDAKKQAHSSSKQASASIHNLVDPVLTPVLDTVENLLDTYLPKSKSTASQVADDAQAKGEEIKDKAASAVDSASSSSNADKAEKEVKHQINRAFDISFSMLDRSINTVKSTATYGRDQAASAIGAAKWSIAHPKEVPQAAYNGARENYSLIRERVDGTVEITRSRASDAIHLAHSARDEAVRVYQQETKSAPKDQPRGLVTAGVNTVFVLTKEVLDYTKDYLQQHNKKASELVDDAKDSVESAANKTADKAQDAQQIVINKAPKATESLKDVASKAKAQAANTKDDAFSRAEKVVNDVDAKVTN